MIQALQRDFDVIVIGGGNAGLSAALAAREQGAEVLIIERATAHMRGGNSRHTRNLRCVHDRESPYTTGSYSEGEFFDDLVSVTGCLTNPDLARLLIRESRRIPQWMTSHGVHWQKPIAGTLGLSRTNLFFLGGGKALLNTYYDRAARMGIHVLYETCVIDLLIEGPRVEGVMATYGNEAALVRARAVVVATGGFEANLRWMSQYYGSAAENFVVRGSPYNDGAILRLLLDRGALSVGDPREFHGVAVDARAPKYDGGIATRVDGIPFGIVVNKHGRRFYDEGEDVWPKRYAIWGKLIAQQPDQIAYVVLDARTIRMFIPPMFPPIAASTLDELAHRLDEQFGLDRSEFLWTVQEYNRAASHNSHIHPDTLDGSSTCGLQPPKSNWALPINHPPFYAFPLRPGITFTYLGVAVDGLARILQQDGTPFQNLFAAGEVMAGNILTRGYLAGIGMTIGSVFGRIAGTEAGRYARQ
jgi:tricarballylate dehydrogenase